MARFSNPGSRFFIWDLGSDNYNHTQLAANLDSIDALFGAPISGTWPSVGNSLYSYVTALQTAVLPLGSIVPWIRLNATTPLPGASGGANGLSGVPTTSGLVVMDGSIVLSGNHSLTDGNGVHLGDVTLPDLRNVMLLGANLSFTDGVASQSGSGSAFAPGIIGAGGSMAPLTHSHTMPNHYHDHNHIHEAGNVNQGNPETSTATVDTGETLNIVSSAVGGTNQVSRPSHHHRFDIYSSLPRDPSDANYRIIDSPDSLSTNVRSQTSLQKLSSGGSNVAPTGGTAGDSVTFSASQDARPAHLGVLYLLKVKNITPA